MSGIRLDVVTWEQRMAHRAAARQVVDADDHPHRGHHAHLQGSGVYCSCGEFRGVTTVAIPEGWTVEDEDALRCSECGAEGVVEIGGNNLH